MRGSNPPDYETFLMAASLFPKFCDEYNEDPYNNLSNQTDACKKELATLFAHVAFESGPRFDIGKTE